MRRNLDLVVFINKQNRDVKYQAAISRDTFRVQEFADARNQHYLPFTDFIDSNPELLTPLRSVYPQFVNNLARRIDLKNRLKNNISNNILTLDSEVMNEIRLLSREGVEVNTLFSRDIKCYAFCISSLDNAVIRWFEDFIPYNFYNLYLDMDNIEILNENIFSYLLKLNSKIHIKKTAKLKIHK